MVGIVEAGGSDGGVDGFGVGLLFRNGFVATILVQTLIRGKQGEGWMRWWYYQKSCGFNKAHFAGCYLPRQITVAVQNSVTSFDPAHFLSSIWYLKSQKY